MADAEALQGKIRAARQRKQQGVTVRVAIPGWPGLVGVYAPVDWRKRVELQRDLLTDQDGELADRVYSASVSTLLAATKTVEAQDDGQTTDLDLPLGVELAAWLGINAAENGEPFAATPEDAVALIIEDQGDVILHAEQVSEALARAESGVDKRIVGESKADS
jgi:hypothetical protein